MAKTVNSAFNEFMRDKVNLDAEKTKKARKSRDNLISNIHGFNSDENFFNLYSEIDISFGSFARRTKKRPLDDIDIMIGIKADGSTYYEDQGVIKVYVNNEDSPQYDSCNNDSNILNSTKVINKFIAELKNLSDYKNADTHKNEAAATLQLKSYEWNFDIVPSFLTAVESNGKNYYLIPDGRGNWQKTDPRRDREHVTLLNKKHNGQMLDTIRLLKYWNKRSTMPSMPSYTFECLVLQYFESHSEINDYIDLRFRDLLLYITNNIFNPIYDPKEIQGNINTLSYDEQLRIYDRAKDDYDKACDAVREELDYKSHEKSIKKWREVLGSEFPEYD